MNSIEGNTLISRGMMDLINNVQSDLNKTPVSSSVLRNKLSDVLKMIDPES